MSTYKVIQDIEAEDKLLGPLTLRQFIYAGIAVGCGFLAFLVGKTVPLLAIPFVVPLLVFGFLAAPWGKDQPTETWAVAKIRFLFKPRKRIWDQTGQKELVRITVPKKEIIQYTDGLSQNEVKSRLEALASTIDTRGWVIKNSTDSPAILQPISFTSDADSDRLTSAPSLPQAVPDYVAQAPVDILDEDTGVSQQFDQMIAASERTHREQIIQKLNAPVAPEPQAAQQAPWFTNQTAIGVSTITPTPDETALLADLEQREQLSQHLSQSHLKNIQPMSDQAQPITVQVQSQGTDSSQQLAVPAQNISRSQQPESPPKAPVPPAPDPAILELAHNDDLDVATIARQANKKSPDEVVISLH